MEGSSALPVMTSVLLFKKFLREMSFLFMSLLLFLNKGKEGALQPALAKVFGFVIRVRLILWPKKQ
jgi:hypothetical protein